MPNQIILFFRIRRTLKYFLDVAASAVIVTVPPDVCTSNKYLSGASQMAMVFAIIPQLSRSHIRAYIPIRYPERAALFPAPDNQIGSLH